MMKNKANLFIVGAAKAGTTSLYSCLKTHRDIFMSPIKEPHFFSKDIDPSRFRNDYKRAANINLEKYFSKRPLEEIHMAHIQKQEHYNKLFETSAKYRYYGECSVSYLFSKSAAQEIYNYNPNSKIIIMLRDPVDRVISHYFMDVSIGAQNDQNILRALRSDYETQFKGWGQSNLYIELSKYMDGIAEFAKYFPKEQILIINFNAFTRNTKNVLAEVSNFLGLDKGLSADNISNQNPTLLPKTRFLLRVKNILRFFPEFVKTPLKKIGVFFEKKYDKTEINNEVIEYIKNLTDEDWQNTFAYIKHMNLKVLDDK